MGMREVDGNDRTPPDFDRIRIPLNCLYAVVAMMGTIKAVVPPQDSAQSNDFIVTREHAWRIGQTSR